MTWVYRITVSFRYLALTLISMTALSFTNSIWAQSSPAGTSRSTFTVDYTGALFGYYRIEEPIGQLRADGTAVRSSEVIPAPVSDFLKRKSVESDPSSRPLLLGMGDNFAPEFGASLQWDETECRLPIDPAKYAPEAYYKDEGRLPNRLECDNVARFLMRAGYRAVVPGREDFIYTAKWTREMALRMQAYSASQLATRSQASQIHMLSSNLRLIYTVNGIDVDANSTLASSVKGKCPLLFAEQIFGGATSPCTPDGNAEALDWLARMDRVLDPKTGLAATIRDAARAGGKDEAGGKYRRSLLINQSKQMLRMLQGYNGIDDPKEGLTPVEVQELRADLLVLSDEKSYDLSPDHWILNLKSVSNSDLNLKSPKKAVKDLERLTNCGKENTWSSNVCNFGAGLVTAFRQIDVGDLLLDDQTRKAGRDALLFAIANEQENVGYTLAAESGGKETLLIGVIGKETMQAVSPTNLLLCTDSLTYRMTPTSLSTCRDSMRRQTVNALRPGSGRVEAKVTVLDPEPTVTSILRGLKLREGDKIAHVVIMAQMPHTEAEELITHVRKALREAPMSASPLTVDLVLSEAQDDHASSSYQQQYSSENFTPVMTPKHAFATLTEESGNNVPVARVQIGKQVNQKDRDVHSVPSETLWSNCPHKSLPGKKASELLASEVRSLKPIIELPKTGLTAFKSTRACARASNSHPLTSEEFQINNDCPAAVTEFLLDRMQLRSHADVVLMERRDLYLDKILEKYDDYDICEPAKGQELAHCKIHVALDRILWKGDYAERVMVTGKDLKAVLKTASGQSKQEEQLSAQDVSNQWLVTLGITGHDPTNLTQLDSNNNTFSVPYDPTCIKDSKIVDSSPTYCVDGLPIADDRSYWVATNDHFAQDKAVYTQFSAEPDQYHQSTPNFLTSEIANAMVEWPANSKPTSHHLETVIEMELFHQQRHLAHVDYSKFVASFSSLHPNGGNQYVANNFQGASDSRASSASKQELDLESLVRTSVDFHWPGKDPYFKKAPWSVGVQSDAEYDRSIQGSATNGKSGTVAKPTANYSLNNFTVGGFIQIPASLQQFVAKRTALGGKALPRAYLVVEPYQYSRQITGTYLIYPYVLPADAPAGTTVTGAVTLHAPNVTSFLQKAGGRTDWGGGKRSLDIGSYIEVGGQFGIFNNLLSGVKDTMSGTVCDASSSVPIATCLTKASLPLKDVSKLEILTQTSHAEGAYWDLHLQRSFRRTLNKTGPGMILSFDSKGDYFSADHRSTSLSTQTRYDVPLSFSIGFPILQNLTLAPTYASFLYQNQRDFKSLVVNSLSISARWYFARDTAVPFGRQVLFSGPASANQSAKTK